MATVSINELKIRLLQLKGIGYDKLLLQKTLTNQLDVVGQELNAISNEIESLTKMIIDANNNATLEENKKLSDPSTSQPASQPELKSHIEVDQSQLNSILSPNRLLEKTEKVKKTEHIIGRRT